MAKKGDFRKNVEQRRLAAVAVPVANDDEPEEEDEREFEEGEGVILGSCPVCGTNHPQSKRWIRHYQGGEPFSFVPQAYLALAQDPRARWAVLAHYSTPAETEAASPGLFEAIKDRFLTAISTWLERGWFEPGDFARFVPFLVPGPNGPPAGGALPTAEELEEQRRASRERRRAEIEGLLRARLDEENAIRRDRDLPEVEWPRHDDGTPFTWQEVREWRRARRQDFIRADARAPLEGAMADFAREEAEEQAAGQPEEHIALGGVEPRQERPKAKKKSAKEKAVKTEKSKKARVAPAAPLTVLRQDVAVALDNMRSTRENLDEIPRRARKLVRDLNTLIRDARKLPAEPEPAEPDPANPSAAEIEDRAFKALDAWNRVVDLQAAGVPEQDLRVALDATIRLMQGQAPRAEVADVPPPAPPPPLMLAEQILGRRLPPIKPRSPKERKIAELTIAARAAIERARQDPRDWERQSNLVLDALEAIIRESPPKEVRDRIYEASESYGRLEAAIDSGNQAAIDQAFVNLLSCCPAS